LGEKSGQEKPKGKLAEKAGVTESENFLTKKREKRRCGGSGWRRDAELHGGERISTKGIAGGVALRYVGM